MHTPVRDVIQPLMKLHVEIVEIAKGAGEEEVLPDVAERALNLAFGLRPVWTTGFRMKAIMLGERQQRAIIDDMTGIILTRHRRLHAIVEDLDRHATGSLDQPYSGLPWHCRLDGRQLLPWPADTSLQETHDV